MSRLFLLLTILFFGLTGWSQTRHESWVRVNLNHWFSPKFGIGLELHHRRQSNFLNEEKNIFDIPMLNIVRPWVYYRGLKNYVLAVSPLSFHDYHDISNSYGHLRNYLEIRSTYGVQRNFNLKNIVNRNRAWYELRFTDVNSRHRIFQTRLRIQNTFLLPIWKGASRTKLNYNLTNEFFVNQRRNLINFDHNRLFNGIQLKKSNYEINLGYQWSRHNASSHPYSRHQLFLNTSFDL